LIEEDVRRLYSTGWFVTVRPQSQRVPAGRVVIFDVLERPILQYVKYVGNERIVKAKLQKEADIKPGDAMNPFAVEEARRRIEEFYRSQGYSNARVSIYEGNKASDRGVIFVINEGQKQRIWKTEFIGNTIASDDRLKTQIRSKPGFFWVFKGEVNREEIDEDVNRLTAYYRSLGFFRARVGRYLEYNEKQNWLTLTFVIDEGPRYAIRNVSFIGNTKFSTGELAVQMKLKAGAFFNQADMQHDVATIRDRYGSVGYIFADVKADPRFLEEPGQLDLVYNIREGHRCRVGKIVPRIEGDFPHTRVTTVLNRMSIKPGDIIDIRELRASERRLQASGLFEVDPRMGISPKIVFSPPSLEELEVQLAGHEEGFRGQSPEPRRHAAYRPPQRCGPSSEDRTIDIAIEGKWISPGWCPPAPATCPAPARSSETAAQPIVRGQYTADAGRTVPSVNSSNSFSSSSQFYPGPRADTPPGAGNQAGGSYSSSAPSTGIAANGSFPASPGGPAASQTPPPGQLPPPGSNQPPVRFFGSQDPAYTQPSIVDGGPSLLDAPTFSEEPPIYIPLEPTVQETRTGRFMLSVGVNSDAGLLASVIVDEQNFDITRFPRSLQDVRDGIAWRGAGQRFRLEAVPGTEVQRYTINFQEPYLFNTRVSLGLSGYFYNRRYREWDEERVGGRMAFGYQFTPDLSGVFAYRGAKITVYDPILPGIPELDEVLGDNSLHGFEFRLTHDTRDNAFLATQGHYIGLSFEQVTGSFDYPRGEIDLRHYFMLHQRPDGSGRHVLSLTGRMSVTGENTPIYEHYYAGGYSTIRGFDFRGASPRDPATGVIIGGEFMLLGSIEYMFPITADDMIRAVAFCDTGTVEPKVDDWTDDYRVVPGVGLRITVPAMGPAPIALDFGFPIASNPGDDEEVFSFFIGFLR